jgi:phosphoenolpyruvate carboxylase
VTPHEQQELRSEIRWLGEVLGHVLKEQAGESTFELVEEVRALARARREGLEGAEDRLIRTLGKLDTGELERLIGAPSVFFDLANLAEDRQRVRVVRDRERTGTRSEAENLDGVIQALHERGLSAEGVQALLDETGIEFVFTAHPTEAKRRSVREKVRDLRHHLYGLDDPDLLPRERARVDRIAERHLQQMLSAVLHRAGQDAARDGGADAARDVAASSGAGAAPDATPDPGPPVPEDLLDLLSRRSREAYRGLVDRPGFIQYFEEATPIRGIEELPIGSRPARRGGERSLDTLRAIPWVFSWTQSRHMIPAWYGLGTALAAARDEPGGTVTLEAFYRSSGFFRATIDNAALALAKADMGIARVHSLLVRDPAVRREIWGRISAEYDRTRAGVLELIGQKELLDDTPWLKRSIEVRNPYVDPLNLVQVELFRRLRQVREGLPEDEASPEERELRDLIRLTIQGIAGGLRTTG